MQYSLFLFLMKYALDMYSFFLEIQTISKISKVLRSVKLHLGKKLKYWSKWKCSFFKTAFFREVMHFHLILISHAYNNRVCVIMAHTTSSMFFTFNWIWKKQQKPWHKVLKDSTWSGRVSKYVSAVLSLLNEGLTQLESVWGVAK